LYKILNHQYGKIFIVHRLDRDTSGLILFAKNETTHKYLSQLFEQRNIEKKYLGIVRGSMPEKNGSINEPIAEHPVKKGVMVAFPSSGGDRGGKKGKPSLTNYEVL
jgi:23S rRNA pseudouridine955/2504/2580 synthase/23S rRNA pseudouridine1911/1915/1917 synthase